MASQVVSYNLARCFLINPLPVAAHNELGELGERLAANFLQAAGYTIVERNWRVNRAEIDIIARTGDTLIFVEVKTRSSKQFGPPELFVTRRKMRLLAGAAAAYMQAVGHEWALRFDVVTVVMGQGRAPEVTHFEDAFFPGLP
jgi:putative endonuclease